MTLRGRLSLANALLFILGLALVSFLFRMLVPPGQQVSVFVYFLSFPTIAYLPQYLSFFILGIIAARRDWLRTRGIEREMLDFSEVNN